MRISNNHQLSAIIMLVLLFVYFIVVEANVFQRVNFLLFDWQSSRLAEQFIVDEDIIIIAIDDNSLTQMNSIAGRWPWPRTVHGQLLASLNELSPAATAFDILFAEKDIYRPDADLYFNEVLAESPRVFLATLEQNISQGGGIFVNQLPIELGLIKTINAKEDAKASFVLPMAINKENWQLGSINFTASADGIGRYYDSYRNINGWHMSSLPAKVVSALELPLPSQQSILLQWRGNNLQPYKTLSYVDVYLAAINQERSFFSSSLIKQYLLGLLLRAYLMPVKRL